MAREAGGRYAEHAASCTKITCASVLRRVTRHGEGRQEDHPLRVVSASLGAPSKNWQLGRRVETFHEGVLESRARWR